MEIVIILFVLTGTLVLGLQSIQSRRRYQPYSGTEEHMLRSLYQVHLVEGTMPKFSLPIQRKIWQEEQAKYLKERSLHADTDWSRSP